MQNDQNFANQPGDAPGAGLAQISTENRPAKSNDTEATRAFAIEVARLCRDDKCEDVTLLDVRGVNQLTDFILIASGTSDRQMHAVMQHVQELGHTVSRAVFRTDADERSLWLIVDFVDLVVHLFEPNTRAHYDLEMLWGDAPRLEWERPDQITRDRAGLNPRR